MADRAVSNVTTAFSNDRSPFAASPVSFWSSPDAISAGTSDSPRFHLPDLCDQGIRRVVPLLRPTDDGIDLDTETGVRAVGRVVEIGTVDLADHEHVDVIRRRADLAGVPGGP